MRVLTNARLWPRNIRMTCFALMALLPAAAGPSSADEQETLVYFVKTSVKPLDLAIEAALSQPPLRLVKKIASGVLIVAVPDRVASNKRKDEQILWQFTTKFSRDGNSLGESYQSCLTSKVLDCTEQIRADVMTAGGMQANR